MQFSFSRLENSCLSTSALHRAHEKAICRNPSIHNLMGKKNLDRCLIRPTLKHVMFLRKKLGEAIIYFLIKLSSNAGIWVCQFDELCRLQQSTVSWTIGDLCYSLSLINISPLVSSVVKTKHCFFTCAAERTSIFLFLYVSWRYFWVGQKWLQDCVVIFYLVIVLIIVILKYNLSQWHIIISEDEDGRLQQGRERINKFSVQRYVFYGDFRLKCGS